MGLLLKTELRNRAASRGHSVGGEQINRWIEVGLLPDFSADGWDLSYVDRLVRISEAESEARQLNRRVVLLRDLTYSDWHTPPDKLRMAMIETIPTIERVPSKMRALYRSVLVEFDSVPLSKAKRAALPESWRMPDEAAWIAALDWPSEDDFDELAGFAYATARSLTRNPRVRESGFLDSVPFEEIVILLLTRELTAGQRMSQDFSAARELSDGFSDNLKK